MPFLALGLSEPIHRAIAAEGYTTPTPIQAQAIPHALEGRDVLGCAQTGTGKTAAFALPILQRLAESHADRAPARGHSASPHGRAPRRPIRALILSPTRELALQIAESFRAYGRHSGLRHAVIFGGVNQNPQTRALNEGVDILVATPGRLLDLMNQGFVDLRRIEIFVLDEADRVLDMGFLPDLRRVVAKLPAKRQTLLFSATMPSEIRDLAHTILREPVSVQVSPVSSAAPKVEQSVYLVNRRHKSALLTHLLGGAFYTRVLVFTRTKHGADKVARTLNRAGIRADAIHGNKSQNARQRALANFKTAKTPVLVASDIAARGIDVDDVSHVINYDLPNVPETYVHRIGRTGRAGATGMAISFCGAEERSYLRDIEKLIRRPIEVRTDAPDFAALDATATKVGFDGHDDGRRERPRAAAHAGHRSQRPQQPRQRQHGHGSRGGQGYSEVHSNHGGAKPTGRGRRGKRAGQPAAIAAKAGGSDAAHSARPRPHAHHPSLHHNTVAGGVGGGGGAKPKPFYRGRGKGRGPKRGPLASR